jgi:Fe-S cluster assembly protein SufD
MSKKNSSLDNKINKKTILIKDLQSFWEFRKKKQIILEEDFEFEIYIFLEDLDLDLDLDLEILQKKNSKLKLFLVYKNIKKIQTKILIKSQAEKTYTELYGLIVAKNQNDISILSQIIHNANYCQSKQIYKFILDDKSNGKFDGLIQIKPNLRDIEAIQYNHNLLLNNFSKMTSIPNLRISSPQVVCKHGSTMGFLNTDYLFYLQTRGLSYQFAKKLLVLGFAETILSQIPILCQQEKLLQNII